jgi:hypothetical protein
LMSNTNALYNSVRTALPAHAHNHIKDTEITCTDRYSVMLNIGWSSALIGLVSYTGHSALCYWHYTWYGAHLSQGTLWDWFIIIIIYTLSNSVLTFNCRLFRPFNDFTTQHTYQN